MIAEYLTATAHLWAFFVFFVLPLYLAQRWRDKKFKAAHGGWDGRRLSDVVRYETENTDQ